MREKDFLIISTAKATDVDPQQNTTWNTTQSECDLFFPYGADKREPVSTTLIVWLTAAHPTSFPWSLFFPLSRVRKEGAGRRKTHHQRQIVQSLCFDWFTTVAKGAVLFKFSITIKSFADLSDNGQRKVKFLLFCFDRAIYSRKIAEVPLMSPSKTPTTSDSFCCSLPLALQVLLLSSPSLACE